MKSIKLTFTNLPENLPVTVEIKIMEKPYSDVRLLPSYDQQKRPAIIPGKYWTVYYYFRNSQGVLKKIIAPTKGLNKGKTVQERMALGAAWVKAWELLLSQGFNPFTKEGLPQHKEKRKSQFTVIDALDYALENKRGTVKKSTYDGYEVRVGIFKVWLTERQLEKKLITQLTDEDIIDFMNWLVHPKGRALGKTSQHNYKSALSAIFGKLKKDKIIKENIVDYRTTKDKPVKNAPFTVDQVRALKKQLLSRGELALYHYLQHLAFAFLRPSEIVRLTVKDISLDTSTLIVATKTERQTVKRIISPLLTFYRGLGLENKPKDHFIFAINGFCGHWPAEEKTKTRYYTEKFNEVKQSLGMGREYTIYSMRHTAALDLYQGYLKAGLPEREILFRMMPITGHRSEEALRSYLRDIAAFLPKDYSGDYSIDF